MGIRYQKGKEGVMPRNRRWSREELVLALDLYFKIGPKSILSPDRWNLTTSNPMGD